jgi:hypothetical protein
MDVTPSMTGSTSVVIGKPKSGTDSVGGTKEGSASVGTASDETSREGTASVGRANEGSSSEGTANEGTPNEGTAREGSAVDSPPRSVEMRPFPADKSGSNTPPMRPPVSAAAVEVTTGTASEGMLNVGN